MLCVCKCGCSLLLVRCREVCAGVTAGRQSPQGITSSASSAAQQKPRQWHIQRAQLPSPKCYRTLKSNNNKNNNNPMMSLLINFLKLLLTLWNHHSIAWSIMYEMKNSCPLCDADRDLQ